MYNRLRYHNEIRVSGDSSWSVDKQATVRDSVIKLSGKSVIWVGAGAVVRNVAFQVASGSSVRIEDGVRLDGMDICAWNGSDVVFGKDGHYHNVDFSVGKGKVYIAEENHFDSGMSIIRPCVSVMAGSLEVGDHNRIMGSFWIRFGGKASIGRYNCINEQTEIRADESVTIGSYNMISYSCDIWDTNTHCAYTLEERIEAFEKDFPQIGKERNRPKTSPVTIGDGNWIGKYACVLKGVTLKDNVTVGTRAIVSNMVVEEGGIVVSPKGQTI